VNSIFAMLAFASAFMAGQELLAQSRSSDSGPCAGCHPAQSRNYDLNGMNKALQRADKSDILRTNAALEFSEGLYRTSIASDDTGSTLTVTDGKDRLTARILWAFGLGRAGQTYVFEHAGTMFESRVSYYEALRGLDLTMGAHGSKPASLTEAAGRRMDSLDVRQCFGCHSTGGIRRNEVVWESMTPGISCESCHGDTTQHVKARRSGVRRTAAMRSLKSISAEEMNELCGACHRTWAQVAEMKLQGPLNVRFQPYRITNSKCFDADDRRIGCTSCHDPHSELLKSAAAYDSACLACHASTAVAKTSGVKSGKVCHTAKKDCVTCHMPKVALPGAHYEFADHQIRVVKPGDAYPN
jgi:hypothetical protein